MVNQMLKHKRTLLKILLTTSCVFSIGLSSVPPLVLNQKFYINSNEQTLGTKTIQNNFIRRLLMESIVDATSQYKRVYGLSAMYPDVSLSVLSGSFSNALFENKEEVGILDVYIAIRDSKRIYPDSRVKECTAFREKFLRICEERKIILPDVKLEDIDVEDEL